MPLYELASSSHLPLPAVARHHAGSSSTHCARGTLGSSSCLPGEPLPACSPLAASTESDRPRSVPRACSYPCHPGARNSAMDEDPISAWTFRETAESRLGSGDPDLLSPRDRELCVHVGR